jgi:phosphatidylglycerophosphate synthase
MRKLPTDYENPFDNYLLDIADSTIPYFYNIGMVPNTITTLSNITCILVIILLFNAKYYWAAFFLIVSYFFDCADGHMARTYKLTSVFGDYYDHISDVTKITFVLITLYYINPNKFNQLLPVIIVIFIGVAIHLGCQELMYKSNESQSLSALKNLCPVEKNDETMLSKVIKSTRFFGCGTVYATLALCIIYYNF